MVARYESEALDVTLDTSKLDPLWQLPFLQVLDDEGEMDPNKIRILAGTLPPLTEQDKKRLVRRLRGTNLELTAVLQEFKFTDYPPHYVERFLLDRVKWDKEQKLWVSVTPAGVGEKIRNLLHFPT